MKSNMVKGSSSSSRPMSLEKRFSIRPVGIKEMTDVGVAWLAQEVCKFAYLHGL